MIMRIELMYEKSYPASDSEEVGECVMRRKKYESDVLDKDMIDSPKGRDLDRFIIDDLQLTLKSDVDSVIEMLKNVKKSLSR